MHDANLIFTLQWGNWLSWVTGVLLMWPVQQFVHLTYFRGSCITFDIFSLSWPSLKNVNSNFFFLDVSISDLESEPGLFLLNKEVDIFLSLFLSVLDFESCLLRDSNLSIGRAEGALCVDWSISIAESICWS